MSQVTVAYLQSAHLIKNKASINLAKVARARARRELCYRVLSTMNRHPLSSIIFSSIIINPSPSPLALTASQKDPLHLAVKSFHRQWPLPGASMPPCFHVFPPCTSDLYGVVRGRGVYTPYSVVYVVRPIVGAPRRHPLGI